MPDGESSMAELAARLPPETGFWRWGRGLVAHLAFAAWAVLLDGWVLRQALGVVHEHGTNPLLGALVLAVLVAEPILLRAKLALVRQRLVAGGVAVPGQPLTTPWGAVLAFTHLALGMVLCIVALEALGGTIESGPGAVVLVAGVLRELYVLGLLLFPTPAPARGLQPPLPAAVVDLGLVAFACIAYSASWRVIAANAEPINQQNLVLTLLYASVAGLLFQFFYLPARAGFFVEDQVFATTPQRRRRLNLSLLLATACALRPLVVIEHGQPFLPTRRAREIARGAGKASLPDGAALFRQAAAARQRPTELRIEQAPLLVIPDDLSSLGELRLLALRNSHLAHVPEALGTLTQLTNLQLGGNPFSALPQAVCRLEHLDLLEVSGVPLTALPDCSGGWPRLTTLYAGSPHLRELPASLASLPSLERLVVTYSGLTSLPAGLGQNGRLRHLSIRGNAITGLPDSIRSSPLVHLDWGQAGLERIPEEVFALGGLRELLLDGNRLARIPDEVARLRELRLLDLRGNPLPPEEQERVKRLLPESALRIDPPRFP